MNFKDVRLSLRLAARDIRGGARALGLLIAGVFVGVAAVALVGAASDTLRTGAKSGALDGVGGDISLRLFHTPPNPQQLKFLKSQGQVSVTSELRPMVNGALVELKGVDANYPLYGQATLQSGLSLQEALAQNGAVADADLGLKLGDKLRIGAASYQLNGILASEPDRAFRAFSLGPRVMVALSSLKDTGLATEGAEIYYYSHLKLTADQDAAKVLWAIDKAFPDAGWRMVNAHQGVPGVERTLSMAHVVLLFMGLGILLIGGAGISSAVRAHISSKLSTIAILKSIGTPPNVVALTIGLEVMAAASVGAVLGVGVGAFAPMLVTSALTDHVPFALSGVPAVKPLLAAALFGVLIALLFAWWPLMSVGSINARLLLRERFDHVPGGAGLSGWLGAGIIVLLILGLVFWVSPMAVLSAVFLVGSLFLAAFYLGLGRLISSVAKRLSKGRSAGLRMALGNLHRAGSPTGAVVMALGLTLTLLVALDGLGRAADHHVQNALPNQAPDVVAFSLSLDQAQGLRQNLQNWDGTQDLNIKPFLHARVQALNGVAVQDLNIPRSLSWVVRGDRGVSYDENDLGAAGLLMDGEIAKKMGLKLGDTLTLNVSGHVVTAPLKGFLEIDWTGLDLVFPIVASKTTLSHIPHTFAGALKANPGRALDMENRIKANFPDVPLIRVGDVLSSLVTALNAMVQGLTMAAMLCGVAALVVLAGSILQGLRNRTDEALLFKVLGARQSQLLGQLALEFVALGLVVALVAVPIGLGLAYGVAKAAGLTGVSIGLGGGVQLAALAVVVTVTVGVVVTSGAYRASASTYLRRRGV
ncbi:MAG: hypothetical protein COB46_11865 [Rhodospirillaceae bacterium]|nr:MAG: hypothetical protein COB46_11865 [Rhodospirillaceae bacterium]